MAVSIWFSKRPSLRCWSFYQLLTKCRLSLTSVRSEGQLDACWQVKCLRLTGICATACRNPSGFQSDNCKLHTTFPCCATRGEFRCSWCSCGTRCCCFPCAKLLNFIESASMSEVGLVIFIRSVSAASVGRHRQGGGWTMPAHWVAKSGLRCNQAQAVVVGSAASGL